MRVRKTIRPPAKRGTGPSKKKTGKKQLGLPFTDVMRLHTEVPRDLKNTLDRACLERKQEGIAPYTQSEIVEDAISDWLISNGYIKKR